MKSDEEFVRRRRSLALLLEALELSSDRQNDSSSTSRRNRVVVLDGDDDDNTEDANGENTDPSSSSGSGKRPSNTAVDLDDMEAEVDVQERDLHLVKVGTPCEIIADAYPERIYRGHLQRMQPLVNRQRGVVQVKVAIDKPDSFLLPDMNARVLFLKEASSRNPDQDLPRIPLKALVPGSDPPAVFILDGSMARLRVIDLGATVGDSVQVRGGLQAEDKVLLPGAQPLTDGKPCLLYTSDAAHEPP